MTKVYLVDAVYADYDGRLILTTEDGMSVSNTIYLESEVWESVARVCQDAERKGRVMSHKQSDEDFITQTIRTVDGMLAGERWDAEARAREEWTREDQLEYEAILDAEEQERWDRHLSRWCQLHDIELVNGQCAACISEQEDEVRNDH